MSGFEVSIWGLGCGSLVELVETDRVLIIYPLHIVSVFWVHKQVVVVGVV